MALNFGKVNRSASFNPTSAFPIDARYYFETLAAAQAEAQNAVEVGSSEGTYHYGQNLVVVENGKATLYLIQPDKTLTEVGSVPVGDGQSIEIVDGKVQLKGFNDYYYAYSVDEDGKSVYTKTEGFKEGLEPRVVKRTAEDGSVVTDEEGNPIFEIAWYEPSTTTVEGLSSIVDTLSQEVKGKADKTNSLAGYGIEDAYTKDETNDAIADAIAKAGHTKREIVTELPAAADADPNTIYMVKVEGANGDSYKEYMLIGDAIEQIGDTSVDLSGYAKDSDLIAENIEVNGDMYGDGSTDYTLEDVIRDVDDRLKVIEGDKLTEEEENAIADLVNGNVVKKIGLGSENATVEVKDGTAVIPVASRGSLGLVCGIDGQQEENSVAVDEMGYMTVNNLNVNKLVQTAGDVLILRGGSATS